MKIKITVEPVDGGKTHVIVKDLEPGGATQTHPGRSRSPGVPQGSYDGYWTGNGWNEELKNAKRFKTREEATAELKSKRAEMEKAGRT